MRANLHAAVAAAVLAAVVFVMLVLNARGVDDARRLAVERGCEACHRMQPARAGEISASAPSWREIAARYAGQPGAEERLARLVLEGTDPARRHWAGQAAFARMLPNATEVSAEEARVLVRWILASR